MYQLELFEKLNDTTNRVWNQVDPKLKNKIVARLGRLPAKAVQEKIEQGNRKEDNYDNFQ